MTEQTKTLDTIQKLLAKAEGTNNAHEAVAFMSKVQELLEKHNISMLELGRAGDDPVGVDKHAAHCWISNSWVKAVAGQLARYYGCRQVTSKRGNKIYMSFAGRESARKTVEVILPFVLKQVRQQAKALREEQIDAVLERRPEFPRTLISKQLKGIGSYERDVGNALAYRLAKLVAEQERKEEERAAVGKALVPVDTIEVAMRDAFPNLKSARSTSLGTTAGAREAADNISLHKQTGGSTVKRIGN